MNNDDWDVIIANIKSDILGRIDEDLDNEASRDEIIKWCQHWTVPKGGGDKESLIAAIAGFVSSFPDR